MVQRRSRDSLTVISWSSATGCHRRALKLPPAEPAPLPALSSPAGCSELCPGSRLKMHARDLPPAPAHHGILQCFGPRCTSGLAVRVSLTMEQAIQHDVVPR